nr:hypothetical protein GCM10020241_64280 [Streptoalloteichus tenebrarius]
MGASFRDGAQGFAPTVGRGFRPGSVTKGAPAQLHPDGHDRPHRDADDGRDRSGVARGAATDSDAVMPRTGQFHRVDGPSISVAVTRGHPRQRTAVPSERGARGSAPKRERTQAGAHRP